MRLLSFQSFALICDGHNQMVGLEMGKARICHVKLKLSGRPSIWIPRMTTFGGCPLMSPVKGWVLTGGDFHYSSHQDL